MAEIMRRWEMDGIGRDALRLREVAIPQPGPGDVLIKVAAVALNHRDKMVIETGRGLPLEFPFTPGSDLAGTVVAVGEFGDPIRRGRSGDLGVHSGLDRRRPGG